MKAVATQGSATQYPVQKLNFRALKKLKEITTLKTKTQGNLCGFRVDIPEMLSLLVLAEKAMSLLEEANRNPEPKPEDSSIEWKDGETNPEINPQMRIQNIRGLADVFLE